MCFFNKKSDNITYVNQLAPANEPAPVKTSADVQAEAEQERQKLGYSYRGLAATILTAGLGDVQKPQTSGVTLGGF